MFRSRTSQTDDSPDSPSPRVAAAREAALEALAPRLAQARDSTRQVANERVLPAAEVARERMAPVVNRAADAIMDAVLPAVTAAAEAYEKSQAVEEIRRRGEAAVATLRTEGPEFARRRWPLIVGFVLTGAAVGAVAGIVTRKRTAEPDWTPPAPLSVPPPVPAPVPPAATVPDVLAVDPDVIDAEVLDPELAGLNSEGLADPDGEVDPVEAEATRSEQ